jgi:hypothetical protein
MRAAAFVILVVAAGGAFAEQELCVAELLHWRVQKLIWGRDSSATARMDAHCTVKRTGSIRIAVPA